MVCSDRCASSARYWAVIAAMAAGPISLLSIFSSSSPLRAAVRIGVSGLLSGALGAFKSLVCKYTPLDAVWDDSTARGDRGGEILASRGCSWFSASQLCAPLLVRFMSASDSANSCIGYRRIWPAQFQRLELRIGLGGLGERWRPGRTPRLRIAVTGCGCADVVRPLWSAVRCRGRRPSHRPDQNSLPGAENAGKPLTAGPRSGHRPRTTANYPPCGTFRGNSAGRYVGVTGVGRWHYAA